MAREARTRVLIVEDDHVVRDAYAQFISATSDLKCHGACGSAEDALSFAAKHSFDVALVDIGLPGMSGLECIRRLRELVPDGLVMMVTVFEDPDRIFGSLEEGASGYLNKQVTPQQLLDAIRALQAGGSPMSAGIARRVVESFRRPASTNEHIARLSPRQTEILESLAKGRLYKEIADKLDISVDTVRTHIRNIYEKLHVRNRTEACLLLEGRNPSATGDSGRAA